MDWKSTLHQMRQRRGQYTNSYLVSCVDEGEKGRGAPNSSTALQIGPLLTQLGWIGLCRAQDTIGGWLGASSWSSRIYSYESIRHDKIIYI